VKVKKQAGEREAGHMHHQAFSFLKNSALFKVTVLSIFFQTMEQSGH